MSGGAPRPALVTGASSGLGAAIARALAAAGHPVALGARRTAPLEALAREIDQAGGRAIALPLDLRDEASIDAFVEDAERALGPIDIAVSNAGIGLPERVARASHADLRCELDTNLLGPMLLARRLLGGMTERATGDLVFVSSLNAVLPRPLQAGYTASKAGLEAFVRVLQSECEGSGVRCSVVRPGPIRTEMGWNWPPAIVKEAVTEWKRLGMLRHHEFLDPAAVAAAVLNVATAPRGVHFDLIEINPEAPLAESPAKRP